MAKIIFHFPDSLCPACVNDLLRDLISKQSDDFSLLTGDQIDYYLTYERNPSLDL